MPKIKAVRINDWGPLRGRAVTDIPETARLVVLLGPNGSGKSSLIAALRRAEALYQPIDSRRPHLASPLQRDVEVEYHGLSDLEHRKTPLPLYLRTAYRTEHAFALDRTRSVQELHQPLEKRTPPNSATGPDKRVEANYKHLLRSAMRTIAGTSATWAQAIETLLAPIRERTERIFPYLRLESIPESVLHAENKEGSTFYFMKGNQRYPFAGLSAGEREVFDLILDLQLWSLDVQGKILCIDEPELHLHSELQSRLIVELMSFVSESSQLWIATHSIGIIRAALNWHRSAPSQVVFLNLREFDRGSSITPASVGRNLWKDAFSVALHDLADLVVPELIVICEGRPLGTPNPERAEFDARVYRVIFGANHPEAEFVSSGSCNDNIRDSMKLAATLERTAPGVKLIRLVDRDDRTAVEVADLVAKRYKVLGRRSIENYLWSDEILQKLCITVGSPSAAQAALALKGRFLGCAPEDTDNPLSGMKEQSGPLFVELRKVIDLRGKGSTIDSFCADTLAPLITPDTMIYRELERDVFG